VLGLARVEASLLVRSLLVLAGLLAGGAVVWAVFGSAQPLRWNAAWRIGFGQLVLGMAVPVAAQLAAGRARRDGMGICTPASRPRLAPGASPIWPGWWAQRPRACC